MAVQALACPAAGWGQDAAMFRARADHVVPVAPPLGHYAGIRWRAPLAGPVRGTVAVVGDSVFVGSGDGHLHARSLATGEAIWSRELGAPVHGSPALAVADGTGLVLVSDAAGTLHALVRADGTPRWQVTSGPTLPFPWGHESGDQMVSSPTVAGDRVYWGAGDGLLRAADVATGRLLWELPTEGRIRSTPAVADGRVVVGSADGHVYAADAAAGTLLWRHATLGASLRSADFGFDRRTIQSSPVVVEGRVFVGARDGFLYALDAATGQRLWTVDHDVSWINGTPAVAGGVLYTGTSDGRFFQAVDVATGAERWRVPTTGIVWTSPLLAGDEVLFVENGGRLVVASRSDGGERMALRLPTPVQGSPVLVDGTVLLGGMDGALYALRLDGAAPLERAVFHDPALEDGNRYGGGPALADWLEARGYQRLDTAGLARWLEAEDAVRRVVVFALDHLPGPPQRLRRYLDAGGSAVWLGVPPRLMPVRFPEVSVAITDIDREATRALLGVSHAEANFDALGVRATAAGRTLGLPERWLSAWSAVADPGLEVLGVDEYGGAAAWRQRYGGPPGTGFVRLWGPGAPLPRLEAVQLAAEWRPGME